MIRFTVAIPAPRTHHVEISIQIDKPDPELHFSIPAWTPGSYLIREFTRYLSEPTAVSGGRPLAVEKTAKDTWKVSATGGKPLTISYSVRGLELSVRTPHIDGTHAWFQGTNALVRVHGSEKQAQRVTFEQVPTGWEVFCPLGTDADGAFVAPDYDVLADAPFEVGPHIVHHFEVLGASHRLIFWAADAIKLNIKKLEEDVRAIIVQNASLFGGTLPYSHYDFIFHVTESLRGGLEHLNSTVLATPWAMFETREGYADMMSLISHEHFHTWNVKRIRPSALGPFDYQSENDTSGLWIAEGFTTYFDTFNAVRAGVVTPTEWLDELGKMLSRYHATPGRFQQSLARAGQDAWIRLYRPDSDSPNRSISYYLKGALVAMALDLKVRLLSGGERSLDQVMAVLWQDFLATGAGIDEAGAVARIAAATGVEVESLLQEWVYGTEDPPFAELLQEFGIAWSSKPALPATLGLELDPGTGGMGVRHVYRDSPAWGEDLQPGDLIFAIDGWHATAGTLEAITKRLKAGQRVELQGIRRGRHFSAGVTPSADGPPTITLKRNTKADDAQRARWTAWTTLSWAGKKQG